jgi:hypothetical protein
MPLSVQPAVIVVHALHVAERPVTIELLKPHFSLFLGQASD